MTAKKTPRAILHYIVFVLFKRKLLIFTILLFTLFSFFFGTFLISPEWKATAKILVTPNPRQQTILFKDLAAPSSSSQDTSAYDLLEILTSNALGKEIVKQFDLDERLRQKAQNPQTLRERIKLWIVKALTSPITLAIKIGILPEGEPNFFADALEELIEDMEDIELSEGSSTVNIGIWAESPDLATGIANSLAAMLIEKTTEFEQIEASNTYDSLKNQLQSVKNSLEGAEDDLIAFKEERRIVDIELEKSLKLQRVDALTAEFDATEKNLFALQSKFSELEKQLTSQPEQLTISEVTGLNATHTGLKNNMIDSEIDLAHRQVKLGKNHQDILGLKARIEGSKLQLQKEQERILLSETKALNQIHQNLLERLIDIEASISELASKKKSLERILDGLKHDLHTTAQMEIALGRLLRSIDGLKDRYVTLRNKLLELEVQRYTIVSEFDVKISDPAFIPEGVKPDWPIWPLNLLVGVVFGTILGVGLAFLREYWGDFLETPDVAEEVSGLPVLGMVSPIPAKKWNEFTVKLKSGNS